MKTVPFILFAILFLTGCRKDISPMQADYFIKFYGSYLDDNGYDVKPAGDGGYVIVGSSQREGRKNDMILIRVDKYGNQFSWSPEYFGDTLDDAAYSVRVLADGGFIIAGYMTVNTSGTPVKNAALIRTDAEGKILWQNQYGGLRNTVAKSVITKETGGFIFAGNTENLSGQKQIYLVNVDDNGKAISTRSSPVTGEQLTSIIQLSDGNFLVAGTKSVSTGSVNQPDSQILIFVLNNVGNDLDNYSFGQTGTNEIVAEAYPSTLGNFFVIGTSVSPDSSERDIMVKKLARRTIIWEKTITGSGFLQGKAISEMDDGSIILIADKIVNGNKNIELYFLNAQGEVIDSREYGASEEQSAEAMNYLDGHIVILGKNADATDMNSMITLIKADRQGNLWK